MYTSSVFGNEMDRCGTEYIKDFIIKKKTFFTQHLFPVLKAKFEMLFTRVVFLCRKAIQLPIGILVIL